MSVTRQIIKSLKKGQFVLIDNVPCRVDKVSISVAGKHGAAKARLEGIGIFDGKRRSVVKPADEEVEVPIIEKKTAQVLAVVGDRVQLMDLSTYETFEVDIPEEKKGQLSSGQEIYYFEVLGQRTIKELK